MPRTFSIRDYPLVIEPTVQVLEGRAACQEGEPSDLTKAGSWKALSRLPTEVVHRAMRLPSGLSHFFADGKGFMDSTIIIAYDSGGCLTHMLVHVDPGHWDVHEMPDELLGRPTRKPSLRLVFKDEQTRDMFDQWLRNTPPLGLELAEPPRRIEVWTE